MERQKDIIDLLDELRIEINESHSMLIKGKKLVDTRACFEILDEIERLLPSSIREARTIMQDYEKIMLESKERSNNIIAEAHSEREEILSQNQIVIAAHEEADRIVAQGEDYAYNEYLNCLDYNVDMLTSLENHLSTVLGDISKYRNSLQQKSQVPNPPQN